MTSKMLKLLTRAELLVSHRGVQGGYSLARASALVSVAAVVEALDGPIAITSCTEPTPGDCSILSLCPTRANWERINRRHPRVPERGEPWRRWRTPFRRPSCCRASRWRRCASDARRRRNVTE